MYTPTKNIVLLQNGLICLKNAHVDNRSVAATVQAELMRFGFMLTQDAFAQMGSADKADIIDFHREVIDYLRYITGSSLDYKPFYPGFPQQVMQMTESQLWMDQFIYYWSNCKFQPAPWTEPFATAFETVKYKMIEAGTEESFQKIFTNLVSANQSIAPQDMEVIKWFVSSKQVLVFPESIPFKENLCTLAAMGLDVPVRTTTDVLRIAVHLSGGDISLPAVPKKMISTRKKAGYRYSIVKETNPERKKFEFKKFTRSERRYILGLLEKTHCNASEMVLKDQRWIRLGEIIHPREYEKEFPRSARAFDLIRNTKVTSWYGHVEAAFKKSFKEGLEKLAERPGEFLRRLDYLLRKNPKQRDLILVVFFEIAVKASNKVLYEVFTHFEGRNIPVTNRSVFIKGARKKTPLPNLPALPSDTIQAIQDTIFQALKAKFALLEPIGDCWIDPELKKVPLPTNMRSLSESLTIVARGQRIPMAAEKKVIRPFIHWNDTNGNEDIDLHGFLMGKTMSEQFGYNGSHHLPEIGCYSGDVRNRRGPCAEYVDINVANAVKRGHQWFLMVAHNFTGRPFSSLKDCVVGVQERDDVGSADMYFRPDITINCFHPKSSASYTLIGVYDLVTREYIHLDLDWSNFSRVVNTGDSKSLFKAIEPFICLPQYSVYDLLSWHVEARGRATSKEAAVTHFLYDDFATSYVKTMSYMGV